MENKQENSGLSGKEKALAFMRSKKPPISFKKSSPVPQLVPEPAQQAPEPELVIGEQTKEGIFLGKWQPKAREDSSLGKIFNFFKRKKEDTSLGKTFNVFAAPQDLPETMGYIDAVKHIAGLKNWNGFDGTNYATDKEIYTALKDGSYNGGWIIPPRELLVGTESYGREGLCNSMIIQPDNLFDHKNKGAFKGTFKTAVSYDSDFPDWYWSSTGTPADFNSSFVHGARFSSGYELWVPSDDGHLSCRPVRLVPA